MGSPSCAIASLLHMMIKKSRKKSLRCLGSQTLQTDFNIESTKLSPKVIASNLIRHGLLLQIFRDKTLHRRGSARFSSADGVETTTTFPVSLCIILKDRNLI